VSRERELAIARAVVARLRAVVQWERDHIAGPDTAYGSGVAGVTCALLGRIDRIDDWELGAIINRACPDPECDPPATKYLVDEVEEEEVPFSDRPRFTPRQMNDAIDRALQRERESRQASEKQTPTPASRIEVRP
jgi:hypothetical protein